MRTLVAAMACLAIACAEHPEWDEVQPGEWLPGGATTNVVMTGRNSFLLPAATLGPADEQDFYSGNAFFNQSWVQAPASTEARDGLGPLFNARSCSGCHFRDGRAAPPDDGTGPLVGLLMRVSVPGEAGPVRHPVYGGQIQDQALPDVPVEATVSITWEERSGAFDDGTPYTLRAPRYIVSDTAHGPLGDHTLLSPRTAPSMQGLGLLEALQEADLVAAADPDDLDGDGISGRIQRHGELVGRFGWKGDATSIPDQVAKAFAGDMGLTSSLSELDDCTEAQDDCLEAAPGGEPEVSDAIFDLVVLYSRTIAPPARRAADDDTVLDGKRLFHEAGCAACHTPSHTTGPGDVEGLQDQLIWPYTDLLLHDMGPGLADGRPVGVATGSEWQTPPLWGIGLFPDVSGHDRLLHDGRARGVAEAILWHDGEAATARDSFRAMTTDERDALITFVEDL